MKNAEIRLAEVEDARSILEIYAPYVANTAVTLTSKVPTLEQVVQTMLDIKKHYPYLVCTRQGEVVGFAYAYKLRPHEAYRWNADLAIYIDPRFQGKGVATALYTALFQILKIQGFCNLYAVITIPNDASVALHHHFGFKELAIMKKSGFKLGAWHDDLYMELKIPGCCDPGTFGAPLPMNLLNKNELATTLAMSTALLDGSPQKVGQ
ncbi:MAG: N-acetyltransferase family protein [Coriobacteriia bacterium]|nr:N-acetyltransferase family protein [Coriobacteriia bacterium]MCL2750079.1 N-acetyltransferase family protein [Coriobacteriia bacterium]